MDFSAHSIIWVLVIGLVIGSIAKLLMPGKDPGGCIITMLLGIAGAFVGTWLGRLVSGTRAICALAHVDGRRHDPAPALSADLWP